MSHIRQIGHRTGVAEKTKGTRGTKSAESGVVGANGKFDSFEALQEFVDLDGHCEFLASVINENNWQKTSIASRFEQIVDQKDDQRLMLGIIGEFSSGKTTLVNALLRSNLLETSVQQATTCAVTYIYWRSKITAEVLFKDQSTPTRWAPASIPPPVPPPPPIWLTENWFSRVWRNVVALFKEETPPVIPPRLPVDEPKPVDNKATLNDFLRKYTATESVAVNIQQVNLGYPLQPLRDGLHILDTPGTNAENPRHLEVTRTAVREICHSALVLIPADAPCSQSLLDFLRGTMADRLHRCIFLVTKLDLLREKERDRQVTFVTSTLKRELSLEQVTVLAASPRFVIDQLVSVPLTDVTEGKFTQAEAEAFIKQFEETESGIQAHLKRNRFQILLESLLSYMAEVMATLSNMLVEKQAELKRRQEHLERSRIRDLKRYADEQKQESMNRFDIGVRDMQRTCATARDTYRAKVLQGIQNEITSATDKDQLRNVALTRTNAWLSECVVWYQGTLQWTGNQLGILEAAENQHIGSEFTKIYKNLTALETSAQQGGVAFGPETAIYSPPTLQNFFTRVDEHLPDNPILQFWNFLFGPNLPELKTTIGREVQNTINSSIDAFDKPAKQAEQELASTASGRLCELIDQYVDCYSETVAAMIAEHQRQEAELQTRTNRTAEVVNELTLRRQNIEQVRRHLLSF